MENIKIAIAANGTTTLATAGKYCDRNVDVEVNVPTGGGGSIEDSLTSNGQYMFAYGNWDSVIESGAIKTVNATNLQQMFYESRNIEDLSGLSVVVSTYASTRTMQDFIAYCINLKSVPNLLFTVSQGVLTGTNTFRDCHYLKSIPKNYFMLRDASGNYTDTSVFTGMSSINYIFNNCYSLRNIPDFPEQTSDFTMYNAFMNCVSLDEITNFPVLTSSSSNRFGSLFNYVFRIKDFTFATQEDGTPYTANMKNQTIDLTYAGMLSTTTQRDSYLLKYNSGITADKEVKDDATYQALKDDPDWFSLNVNYSRYNHDSAVNTINSLPDCSASGGTNTIKFKGAAGALTDGGAINTLTEAEIAVAAAKGWTVSLV